MTEQQASETDAVGGDGQDPQAVARAWVEQWLAGRVGGAQAPVTLDDFERVCWRLSGWKVDQRDVDVLKDVVARYVQQVRGDRDGDVATGDADAEPAGEPEPLAASTPVGEPDAEPQWQWQNCPHCWDAVSDLVGHLIWCEEAKRQKAAEKGAECVCGGLAGVGRPPGPDEGGEALLGAFEGVQEAEDRGREAGVWPKAATQGAEWLSEGLAGGGWTAGLGALVQTPDGAVWRLLGVPERVGSVFGGDEPLAETADSSDLSRSDVEDSELVVGEPTEVLSAEPVAPEPETVLPDEMEPAMDDAMIVSTDQEPVESVEPPAQLVETVRTCRVCGKTKPLTEFRRDPRSPLGKRTACGMCENDARRDRRAKSKETRRHGK